jgi:hypothetical protein
MLLMFRSSHLQLTNNMRKDSTRLYFPEPGDPIRQEVYRNDTLARSSKDAPVSRHANKTFMSLKYQLVFTQQSE